MVYYIRHFLKLVEDFAVSADRQRRASRPARFDLLREPLEPSKHARQQYHVCVTTFARQGLDFALTLFLSGGEVPRETARCSAQTCRKG